MIPLVIDNEVREQIKALIELAQANPVDMITLEARLKDPEQKKQHRAQMTRQTITIPVAFMVTFSMETGHPVGLCRHMSMSIQGVMIGEGRVPNPPAVWMIAHELGFWGGLDQVAMWPERLSQGLAINLVQPVKNPADKKPMISVFDRPQ